MLKGEAFFDIQKSRIPFEVISGSERIRVLGTAFNVLAYSESGFVTTLVRGSVEINSENGHQRLTLQPGQQVRMVGDSLVKSKVETELFTSWKDGKMIFKREPFPNLMKRLERWFNVKIEYEPDKFKDLWYSGTIENETITEVMEMVGTAAPVRFTFDSRTRIIKVMPRKK
jgi:ferric-dicitrate binding protein FerR (iron transport regulator)